MFMQLSTELDPATVAKLMSQLGKVGGSSRSKAKVEAARRNIKAAWKATNNNASKKKGT